MFATLVVLSLAVPADPPKDKELPAAAKKELKKLEGKWKGEKVVSSAEEKTLPDSEGLVEFQGQKVRLDGKDFSEITALDPTADPKLLDFKVGKERLSPAFQPGQVYESIYKIDGDTLMWAVYVGEGNKRPGNFDPPKDAGFYLITLKRVKE